jgi:DNA processing protein
VLSDEQRLAWLRLIRSENIGPVTFRELINHFGSAADALAAAPELARRGGRTIRLASQADARRELDALAQINGRMIALGEAGYPPALKSVAGAPPVLAVRGNTDVLGKPAVAVVGSRNASIAGRKFAMQIGRALGEAGFAVASGLARGIDTAAHEASLDTGTIAVFAGGLDQPYPPENVELAGRILDAGAHISEMPMGWEPRGRDFPRRNRIISGLSLAVVVIEAALRSGSLITARRAADQGRLVFAVPGSPLDPRAGGTNLLIKDGATIVTSISDMIAEIMPLLEMPPPPPAIAEDADEPDFASDADDSDRSRILSALGPTPVDVDSIVRFTGVRPAIVHLVLLELALAGRIERIPGQRVALIG